MPSRELYRAALEDALAYTADRDGCGECDGAQLCETHTSRAARAEQYEWALEQEMEPTTRAGERQGRGRLKEGRHLITEIATPQHVDGVVGRLAGRITQLQRQLSNRTHANGDAFAREHGWEITTTTGRLGFGARGYHDPRFSQRAVAARPGPGMVQGRADER